MSPSNHPPRVLTALVAALLLVPLAVPAAAVDDPTVTVPDGVSTALSSTVTVPDLEVTGFAAEANVLVSIAVDSGNLGATAGGGATVTDNGDLLRISGVPADVNATLATVTYTSGGSASSVSVDVSVITTDGDPALNLANGHWYEFVSVPATISWVNARAAAELRSLGGASGYLVTVTSQEENDFVKAKLEADGWMGASDAAIEGEWRWVTGPEALLGAEAIFWQGGPGGSAVAGRYNNWRPGTEPNDSSGEDAAQFYTDGEWNDLDHETHQLGGYVVEYGGLGGEVTPDATGTFTITIYDVPDAPSDLTARAGNSLADLSWTAPGGDEPTTGYRIDQSDDDGGTWTTVVANTGSTATTARINDLDNGTEYLFRVIGLNDSGAGVPSNTAAVTPRQPAPACPYNTTSYADLVGGWTVPCWTAPTLDDTATDATEEWQQDGVAFGIANGIVAPASDGTIGADRTPSRGEVAKMLHTLAGRPLAGGAHDFDDVPVGYRAALDWLADLGIVEGVGDASFAADRPITRAELVTLIWRMTGSPAPTQPQPFGDEIPAWANDAVRWAEAEGVVNGRSPSEFDPNAPATVAEVLAVLYRWTLTIGS